MTGRKRTVSFLCAAAFLTLCALLPLAFVDRDGGGGEGANPGVSELPPEVSSYIPSERSRRVELYRAYKENKNMTVTSLEPEELWKREKEEMEACSERFSQLYESFNVDSRYDSQGENGVNYFAVTDSDGATVRIAESYNRWYGDWENWLRIAVDLDSLELYYIYLSSNCINNFADYSMDQVIYIDDFIEAFAGVMEMGVESVIAEDPSSSGAENRVAILSNDTGSFTYRFSGFTGYDPSTEYLLIDYTVYCLPGQQINAP